MSKPELLAGMAESPGKASSSRPKIWIAVSDGSAASDGNGTSDGSAASDGKSANDGSEASDGFEAIAASSDAIFFWESSERNHSRYT